MKGRTIAVLVGLSIAGLAVLRCGGDDGSSSPSAQDQTSYCKDVSEVSASLEDVSANTVPLNEAALQQSMQEARADIDSLYGSARKVGGSASASVETLVRDIEEFRRLLATPNLVTVLPELRKQSDAIKTDLTKASQAGGCGA